MRILLKTDYVLTIPDNYKKIPLPGLTEWVAALRTRKDRGEEFLCHNGRYCCLGVLSELQGRLAPAGCDLDPANDTEDNPGDVYSDGSTLNEDNPLFIILGHEGSLPYGVMVDGPHGLSSNDLTGVNDSLEQGDGWERIPVILETLYYDPKYGNTTTA